MRFTTYAHWPHFRGITTTIYLPIKRLRASFPPFPGSMGTEILLLANFRFKTLPLVRNGRDSRFKPLWMADYGRARSFLLRGMTGADGTTTSYPQISNNGTAGEPSIRGTHIQSLTASSFDMVPVFRALSLVRMHGRGMSRRRSAPTSAW